MKYLLFFLTFLFSFNLLIGQPQSLLSEGGTDCPEVHPTSSSRPHMAACFAGLEKYLARSINVRGFDRIYMPEDDQNCATNVLEYCPDRYREIVNKIADLNSGYIMNAAGLWGNDYLYSPETTYQTAVTNLVNDINNAYDCRGLRRPIIQASIWETVDPNTNKTWPPPLSSSSAIGTVSSSEITRTGPGAWVEANLISTDVMIEFFGEMTDQEKDRYFTNRDISMPLDNVYYVLDNLSYQYSVTDKSPDVTKIEGRMWMYQQARFFIDAGFNAIKFGQSNRWGRLDEGGLGNGPGGDLIALTSVIDKIRAYADTKQFINYPPVGTTKGIILTHETFGGDLYRNNDPNDELLFDHNSYGYRGNEIDVNNKTQIEMDFLAVASACDQPNARNSLLELFPFYRTDQFQRWDLPGTKKSSRGCSVSGNRPFSIYLDNGRCVEGTVGQLTKNGGALWGWDDKAWFINELDEACKADWMEYEIQAARVLDNYGPEAFMEATVVVDAANCYDAWTFADDPNDRMFNAIQSAWETKTPTIQITGSGSIRGLKALNIDNTSIYSWHIKLQNGNWLPFTYGIEKNVSLPNGLHEIRLRQDNIGIPTSENLYGVREIITFVFILNWGGFKLGSENANELAVDLEKSYSSQLATPEQIRETELYSIQNGMMEENPNSILLKESSGFDINTNPNISKFEVFPNPTSDNFIVTMPISKSGNLKLSLYNTLGKKIKELANEKVDYRGDYSYEGTLSGLPAGTYLVLLELDGAVQIQKLFKQ